MDTNIENYTLNNLIDIFELDKHDLSLDKAVDKYNFLMSQSKPVEVKQFIKKGFEKILLHIDDEMENESIGDETEEEDADDEDADDEDADDEDADAEDDDDEDAYDEDAYDEEEEEEGEGEYGEEKKNSKNNNINSSFDDMIGTSGMTNDQPKDNEITDPNHATYDQANNDVSLSNQVSVIQGNKNPILKNTIKKTLIIDSECFIKLEKFI